MPEVNGSIEHVTATNDDAIDNYITSSLERISSIIDLLVKAEEAYTLSKTRNKDNTPADEDWKKNRDGWRGQGTALLNEAWALFNKQQGN